MGLDEFPLLESIYFSRKVSVIIQEDKIFYLCF